MCHLVLPTNEVSYLLKPEGPACNSNTVRGPGKLPIFYISRKRSLCSSIWSTAKGLITQTSESDPPSLDSHLGHSLGSRLLESPSIDFLICGGFPSPVPLRKAGRLSPRANFSSLSVLISFKILPMALNTM